MAASNLHAYTTVRTTVSLPAHLLGQADQFIGKDAIPSRNALIVAALEHFLAELERQDIDRQFAEMGDDPGYLAFSEEFSESFAESDWQALQDAEAA